LIIIHKAHVCYRNIYARPIYSPTCKKKTYPLILRPLWLSHNVGNLSGIIVWYFLKDFDQVLSKNRGMSLRGDWRRHLRASFYLRRAPPTGAKSWDLSQDFVRIIRVLPIADASQMICDWAIMLKLLLEWTCNYSLIGDLGHIMYFLNLYRVVPNNTFL